MHGGGASEMDTNNIVPENISRISGNMDISKINHLHTQDDRTTAHDVLSIFNEKDPTPSSPARLPAHQLLDDKRSLYSKRSS